MAYEVLSWMIQWIFANKLLQQTSDKFVDDDAWGPFHRVFREDRKHGKAG